MLYYGAIAISRNIDSGCGSSGSNKINFILNSTNKLRDYLLLTDITYAKYNANLIIIYSNRLE